MLVLAAAVVPHPPLLVPALAAGAAGLVAPLLAACDAVVAGLLARAPRTVVLIGSGQHTGIRSDRELGTLDGFGANSGTSGLAGSDLGTPGRGESGLGMPGLGTSGLGTPGLGTSGLATSGLGTPGLPLSLTIGRWLLARAGWTEADATLVPQEVAAGASTEECQELGRRLAAETGPDSVWLALGDGSARRGPRSPGHDDPRAAGFDAEVVRAFAAGDLKALLALDSALAAELGAAGRPVWQVLAAAVAAAPDWPAIEAAVHYDDAPFGVEYLVADWRPRS